MTQDKRTKPAKQLTKEPPRQPASRVAARSGRSAGAMSGADDPLARVPLRNDVYETVRARILSGALPPGSRLVESRLAADLGLSRTPLREALFRLEQEGFVEAHLARGFSVTSLTTREVRELYPILGALEVCALQTLGLVAVAAVPALTRINTELAALAGRGAGVRTPTRASDRALVLDEQWHETLTARCPNQRLLALIRHHWRAISRYERVYWQDTALIPISVAQHQAIITALTASNLDDAVRALERNWRHALEALLVRIGEL